MDLRAWCNETHLLETATCRKIARLVEIRLLKVISRPNSLRAVFVALWMLSCRQQGADLELLLSMRDPTQSSTSRTIKILVAHAWPPKWWSLSSPVVRAIQVALCTKRLFQMVGQFLSSNQSRPGNRHKDLLRKDTNLPWESPSKEVSCSTTTTRVSWDIRRASEVWQIPATWPHSGRTEAMRWHQRVWLSTAVATVTWPLLWIEPPSPLRKSMMFSDR